MNFGGRSSYPAETARPFMVIRAIMAPPSRIGLKYFYLLLLTKVVKETVNYNSELQTNHHIGFCVLVQIFQIQITNRIRVSKFWLQLPLNSHCRLYRVTPVGSGAITSVNQWVPNPFKRRKSSNLKYLVNNWSVILSSEKLILFTSVSKDCMIVIM